MSTELVRRATTGLPNADEVRALAQLLYEGGMTNKSCNRPGHIAAKILAGMEVGLKPVQSCNWIAIINGRAVIWGDAALALVRASGLLESIQETVEGEGDERVATCITKRHGQPAPRETRFSVADAKRANLWGKDGPWTEYPDRQLGWRARGWNLRDEFGDILSGLGIAEEELDVPIRILDVKADTPKDAPALVASTSAAIAETVPTDAVLTRIALARPAWLRSLGIDPEDAEPVGVAWRAKLGEYRAGATSAKQLTAADAERLAKEIGRLSHAQELDEVFTPTPSDG